MHTMIKTMSKLVDRVLKDSDHVLKDSEQKSNVGNQQIV